MTRRLSNGFKKLIASADRAYHIVKVKDRGRHVALDAEEMQIGSVCWYALATFHEMQPMCESERDSLVFIQKWPLGSY